MAKHIAEQDIEYEAIQACRAIVESAEVMEKWEVPPPEIMAEAIAHCHAVVKAQNEATSHAND